MSCPICGCSNFETILSKPSIPILQMLEINELKASSNVCERS